MINPIRVFEKNIESIDSLSNIYLFFENKKVEALDFSEILRAEYVLLVSAFDHFIHEIVKSGMLKIFDGTNTPNKNYENFAISLKTLQLIMSTENENDRKSILDGEIKKITSKDSYQSPSNVEKALSLIDLNNVWLKVSSDMNMNPADIKSKLALIVNRRNKIAHEADFDYLLGHKIPIDRILVDDIKDFITNLVKAINSQI